MEVILKQPVEKLGEKGERVTVSNGYARNYLVPKGLAVVATPKNLMILEHEQRQQEQRQHKEIKGAEKIANKIRSLSCVLKRQAGEQDKLFGSVTSGDIAQFLKNQGVEIDRKQILLEEPIKALGTQRVPIQVHPEVTVELKVKVQKDE
ncbi:50S ribosomal protein L9 [candidate division KSB3 bacterium]|uniref:Large ribosomal subunit protein bL9 n=1 Tax=candidate division KSB3 bacterium TaxID=2044937 RepID=A0A9D5K0F7_9BACT|nr:50S ribosomal protein L9 [candidate division KSB3 bacterium]MBD3327593.1 50S ribosomal protein L9 [candidate division KSB3 bacterium]